MICDCHLYILYDKTTSVIGQCSHTMPVLPSITVANKQEIDMTVAFKAEQLFALRCKCVIKCMRCFVSKFELIPEILHNKTLIN